MQPSRIGFLSGEERSKRVDTNAYRVMVFRHLGHYPRGTIFVPNGFFHADDQVVFSVVFGPSWRQIDPELPYSEFDWASPEEIRLLASILMCEKRDDAYISFYPVVDFSLMLDSLQLDLSSSESVELVRNLILSSLETSDDVYLKNCISQAVGNSFNLIEPERYNLDRLILFWDDILPLDYVLIRGIYSLIKSDMLCCYREFCEEALLTLYISLESSFQLVLQVLEGAGVCKPTAHDAAVWLHEHFDKPFGIPAPDELEKYFEVFYEERIMTLHPSSRFGDYPFSPTMHDDVYHLRRALREIFAYIIVGSHGPDFEDDVRENAQRSSFRGGSPVT